MSRFLTPTPQEILDEYDVDVFAETVGLLDGPAMIIGMLEKLCWQRFRDRMIGDYDYEYWLVRLNDKVETTWLWYGRIAEQAMDAAMTDLGTHTRHLSIETSEESQQVVANVDSDHTETLTEDMPATPINPDDVYLSGRNNVTRDTTSDGTSETDTSSSAVHDEEIVDGLKIEVLGRVMNGLREANAAFVRELDELFINRW